MSLSIVGMGLQYMILLSTMYLGTDRLFGYLCLDLRSTVLCENMETYAGL